MKRINVSATIRRDLIEWAKKQVESGKYRSISHILEYALLQLKKMEETKETA